MKKNDETPTKEIIVKVPGKDAKAKVIEDQELKRKQEKEKQEKRT